MGIVNFRHVMLHDEDAADHLDVDRHGPSIVGRRPSGGKVIWWCTTLVFLIRQRRQPLEDVDLVDWCVDDRPLLGMDEDQVVADLCTRARHHVPLAV
jgi:hypothetical protein